MKTNVLLLADTLKGGGIEEWVKEISRLVSKEEFNVTVAYLIDLRYRDGYSFAKLIKGYGIDVEYIGFSKTMAKTDMVKSKLHSHSRTRRLLQYLYLPASLLHLPPLYRLIKRKNIDVIHANMHYSLVLSAVMNIALGIPVIYQVSESIAQLQEGRPPWIFHAMRLFNRRISTFFTALSVEELHRYGKIPIEKIKPIRGAINLEDIRHIRAEENPVIEKFGLKGAYPILLSVGRFTPEKGHAHSIEVIEGVVKTLPNAKLIILGDGWEYENIRDMIKEKGLGDHVILPGFRADLQNFHSIADIYIRTNLIETGTLASFQAMAYGIAVVGFKNPIPDCIINRENGILVERKDSAAMAKAVVELAKNEELRKRLGENGRLYVFNNLDIKNAIKDFEKEYLRLSTCSASGKKNS